MKPRFGMTRGGNGLADLLPRYLKIRRRRYLDFCGANYAKMKLTELGPLFWKIEEVYEEVPIITCHLESFSFVAGRGASGSFRQTASRSSIFFEYDNAATLRSSIRTNKIP